jgi:4-hydroxy-tetrahydrodipicolinate reductase
MKIALIGYGRMGRTVERIALERGHLIGARIDNEQDWIDQSEALRNCDAAVEFSLPHIAVDNILRCFAMDIPVVSGTTGWFNKIEDVRAVCLTGQNALVYASNFSIGVNILLAVNEYLAGLMDHQPQYEVGISETHHIHKADKPSGTAISLAEGIIGSIRRKTKWVLDEHGGGDAIRIESKRIGEVTGVHRIKYESLADVIEIRHEAKNRDGFALGAVMAAEWIKGKRGCHRFRDILLSLSTI